VTDTLIWKDQGGFLFLFCFIWFFSLSPIVFVLFFFSMSPILRLYSGLYWWDVIITGEVMQRLGLCSALRDFEQGDIFTVPHLLWHMTLIFPVSSEGPPHSENKLSHANSFRLLQVQFPGIRFIFSCK
jgi:hypothetical protein